jgi:tetratricopeptide (TPR) repeat protein
MAAAESLRWQALRSAQMHLGDKSPALVLLSTQLGATLHMMRRDAEAEPVLRGAVEIATDAGDAKLLGIALSGLATALAGEGEQARAEPVMRRSLALLERSEGEDTLDTANAANNLAVLYCDTNQYPEAEEEMKLALSFYESHFVGLESSVAMGLRNMFVILFKQRRTAEAEPYLDRALAIGVKIFPPGRKLAELQFAQGLLQESRGRFQEAAATLQHVIEVQERVLGSNHPQLAHSLIAYSAALRHLHRRSEAKEAQKRGSLILKSLQ